MPRIDELIGALYRLKAAHLEVTAGSPITVGVNGVRRAVTSQPIAPAEVDRLLQQITPEQQEQLIRKAGGYQFTYTAPSGAARVTVRQSDGSSRLLIRPLTTRDASAADAAFDQAARPPEPGEPSNVPQTDTRAAAEMEALFRKTVEEGCSDLHLSTGAPPFFRKNGVIVAAGDGPPLTADEARALLYSITPPHKQEDFERDNDVDFAHEIADLGRFRCNLFRDRRGTCGVFRFIPSEIMTVEDLRLPAAIVDLCKLPKGLVLVTGPTGSGKSTTLAALVDHVNRTRPDHVVTIEDPIEFVHPNKKCLINQREVGAHTRSFKIALRAALREDPDVVLVGEMRDLETVAIAIETAETGHLVFGTVHTNTAASTVDRIIDQFPADQQSQIRVMLAGSLKGVISQTLVRAMSRGRVAAMEFLLVTSAVANLIREGKTYQIPSVMQTGRGLGMQTMNDALLALVTSGQVDPEEAYLAAIDKPDLLRSFQRSGVSLPAGASAE